MLQNSYTHLACFLCRCPRQLREDVWFRRLAVTEDNTSHALPCPIIQHSTISDTQQGGSKSKLLILSECVNKTEKIGGM